jgi:ABC-type multidrug transport system fused ATPase/permease subunit
MVAHRLATVRHADRIIVLDKGRIIESGRHEELLRKPGLYRHMYITHYGEASDAGLAPVQNRSARA